MPIFAAKGGDIPTPKKAIFIHLDRAYMFLTRVDTNRMRAQGNVQGADAFLVLQQEWATALHAYEIDGIAVKKERK